MTYIVCNDVTHSVTCGVTRDVRTPVQNQNQNQIVLKASCEACRDQAQIVAVSYALLGLEPMA